jgi:CDP-diglyceride synthetase
MLWEWLKATFSNWQSWLSGGGVGGACVVLIALVEQFTKWKLSPQWKMLLFLVVFVLGASFMSWKWERQLLSSSEEISSLRKQISDLSQSAIGAQIVFAILGQQPQGSHAGIIVSLHNSGAASAVLPNSWKLSAVAEDGRVVEGWANTLKTRT